MKAVLELLDGQPITIQDEILRLPSSSPLPQQQRQQQQIDAKEHPEIGNAMKKKDEEGNEKEDGGRNFDAIHQEPLQSEIRGVSE